MNSSSKEYTSIESVPVSNTPAPIQKASSPPLAFSLPPLVWISLAVMSIAGSIAVGLNYKVNAPEALTKENATKQAPTITRKSDIKQPIRTQAPTPADKPKKQRFTNNINLIAKHCANMVTAQKSFAVFEHGTCVLLIEPLEDPVVSARSTLKLLADPDIEFEVKALNNNNYLVVFDKYLFCWFSAEQLAQSKEAMLNDRRLARSHNDSPLMKSLSNLELRIGKLARLCLLTDSRSQNLQKIIRANNQAPPTADVLNNLK